MMALIFSSCSLPFLAAIADSGVFDKLLAAFDRQGGDL